MNKQAVETHLAQLGLDPTEVAIYLHLLRNGARTPLELSREAKVNRTKIYRYIERLKSKKLAEESNFGRGIRIEAADPRNLELLVQEREAEIQEQKGLLPGLLGDLKNLGSAIQSEFKISHYHGMEGLKQMTWNQLAAKKEILQFAYQTRNEVVGRKFAERIREEQVTRKIKLYEIENATDQGQYWYTGIQEFPKFYESRHIPEKVLTIRQNTSVFNDTVSIMNWTEGGKGGIEIINPSFARTVREIFWHLWKIAGGSKPKNSRTISSSFKS